MRNYELIYVLKPNLDDETKAAIAEKIESVITANGTIEKIDVWGNKRLAYEIQKLNDGFYVLVKFSCAVDVPKEVDRILRINENVIRHMIVNIDDK